MATQKREWKESPISQGAAEEIAYIITIPSSWGTPPYTSLAAALFEDPYGDNTDVSDSKLTGSITTSDDTITTKTVTSLTAGTLYRYEITFTTNEGNVREAWGEILGER